MTRAGSGRERPRLLALRTLALTLVALVALSGSGCGFAVKHPAATAAMVGGGMALGTCELSTSEHRACFYASGGAAALLGLIAFTAVWLGGTDEDSILQPPPDPVESPRRPAQARPAVTLPPAPPPAPSAPAVVPDYLKDPPHLFARAGDAIVDAPPGDNAVAATYARSPARGPLRAGVRITILTERTRYKIGEEVRVIHVLEIPEPGQDLYVMGPKAIHSEYVDGVERTPPPPAVQTYDGRVVPSPGADFNYEVTTYRFTTPGPHRIQWRAGGLESNVIELEVAP